MKKIKILLCFLLFLPAMPAVAYETVYDPTACGHLIEEVIRLEEQISYMKREIERLGDYNWNDASAKINELGGLVNQANSIAYSAGNLDSNFRKTYPGYQTKTPTNYSDQYKQIVEATQNTLNGVLQSIGSSATDFENESSRLKTLQDQAQNADGQTQAIQAASQIASAEAEQLQLMRQTMIAQTNAQTAYYAAQTQKESDKESSLNNALDGSYKDVNGKLDANPINDDFNF